MEESQAKTCRRKQRKAIYREGKCFFVPLCKLVLVERRWGRTGKCFHSIGGGTTDLPV